MRKLLLSAGILFSYVTLSAQTWKELNSQVVSLYKAGEYEKALPLAEKAVEAIKKELGEENKDYLSALRNLASVYEKNMDYTKAAKSYIRLQELTKKMEGENSLAYAKVIFELGTLYFQADRFDKAEPLFKKALEIRKEKLGTEHADYAAALNSLASTYVMTAQYEEAEKKLLEALALRKKIMGDSSEEYATSLNNLGVLYSDMGLYEKAEATYKIVIGIRKKLLGEWNEDYASSLNNLAVVYYETGKYEKAEPLFKKAGEIVKKVEGELAPRYAFSLNNLAQLYMDIDQYDKAEPLLLQATEIIKKSLGENTSGYATCLHNLAGLYMDLKKYNKAEELLLQAISIRKNELGIKHPEYANSLNSLAGVYLETEQYAKAAPRIRESTEIFREIAGEVSQDYAICLFNMAELSAGLKKFDSAIYYYGEGLAVQKKVFGEQHPDYAGNLHNLANLYLKAGKPDKAEPLLIENSRIIRDLLGNSLANMSEKEKGYYLGGKSSILESHCSFLYNWRRATPEFYKNNINLLLFFKSLALADTKNLLESIRQSTDTTIRRLFTAWNNGKTQLAKEYAQPIDYRRPGLKKLETETEEIEKELNRLSASFRNQQQTMKVTWDKVQQSLQEDEAAIEFVRFNLFRKNWTDSFIYAAYIFRKQDAQPVFVPLAEEKQLKQLFDSAGNTATAMVNSFYRGTEVKGRTGDAILGKALYRLIWAPLMPYLKDVRQIAYSPAGKLFSVAFPALPVDSNSLLMDRFRLRQYTSTRQLVLRNGENNIKTPQRIALFGDARFTMDSLQLAEQGSRNKETGNNLIATAARGTGNGSWTNLPGTATEVLRINDLFTARNIPVAMYTQASASEENLKAFDGQAPELLHIATHGFFLPGTTDKKNTRELSSQNSYSLADDPLLRSGLVLAGGNWVWSGKAPIEGVEDGIVTAYEISQLNLSNTELVVLSACETALGDVKGSEGVFGLQRAFKMAGVKKMIVSLWQVPDKETAELMTVFYTYWLKGKKIEEAFAQAQSDMRKKYSPYYWAAFVLVE